jgi:hypothetical protein
MDRATPSICTHLASSPFPVLKDIHRSKLPSPLLVFSSPPTTPVCHPWVSARLPRLPSVLDRPLLGLRLLRLRSSVRSRQRPLFIDSARSPVWPLVSVSVSFSWKRSLWGPVQASARPAPAAAASSASSGAAPLLAAAPPVLLSAGCPSSGRRPSPPRCSNAWQPDPTDPAPCLRLVGLPRAAAARSARPPLRSGRHRPE